jgi:hypothetical protein
MILKHALSISFILHIGLFSFLLSSIDWPSFKKTAPNTYAIEARLLIKPKEHRQLLPQKKKSLVVEKKNNEKALLKETKAVATKRNEKAKKKTPEKLVVIGKNVAKKEQPIKNNNKETQANYTDVLALLSKSFASDLAESEDVETNIVEDASYFDQVYSLIKQSFIVPAHINGPEGRKLQSVLKIFLASDGSLNKLELVASSGDEHFDKAVMDGTRRVNNFGAVPIFLQTALKERGIIVELCPFTCADH